MRNITEETRSNISFDVLDTTIKFNDKSIVYWKLNSIWEERTTNALDEFEKEYYNCGSLEEFCKKGQELGAIYIYRCLEILQRQLINRGNYDATIDGIVKNSKYKIFDPYLDAYDEIDNRYINLCCSDEEYKEYLKAKKASRGRWVGGGFGVTGAIKGAVTAGAFNAVSGLFASAGNVIASGINTLYIKSECKKIYKDKKTLETLKKGLRLSLYCLFLEELDRYLSNKERPNFEYAYNLLENIEKIPKEKQKQILAEIISIIPGKLDPYLPAVNLFKDYNGELQKIADYFNIGDEFYLYKLIIIDDIFKEEPKEQFDSMEKLENLRQKYIKIYAQYGITDLSLPILEEPAVKIHNSIATIDKHIYDLNIKLCTFDGFVYETKEQAELAQKAKSEAEELLTESVSAESFLKKTNEYKKKYEGLHIAETTIPTIEKKYNELEIAERTVDKKVYSSSEETVFAKEIYGFISSRLQSSILLCEDLETLRSLACELEKTYSNSPCKEAYQHYMSIVRPKIKSLEKAEKIFDGFMYSSKEEAIAAKEIYDFVLEKIGRPIDKINDVEKLINIVIDLEEGYKGYKYQEGYNTYVSIIEQRIDYLEKESLKQKEKTEKDNATNKSGLEKQKIKEMNNFQNSGKFIKWILFVPSLMLNFWLLEITSEVSFLVALIIAVLSIVLFAIKGNNHYWSNFSLITFLASAASGILAVFDFIGFNTGSFFFLIIKIVVLIFFILAWFVPDND